MIRILNVAIVVLLIWLLNDSFKERREPITAVNAALETDKTPDYYSENLTIRQYDDTGKLQSKIKTQKLSHYVDQQFIALETPELLLYGVEGNKRTVTATSGSIDTVSHNLTLIDNIILEITDKTDAQKMLITTSSIQYTVAENFLWTDKDVFAEFSGGTFKSEGFQMNLETDNLLLNNNAMIHYDL